METFEFDTGREILHFDMVAIKVRAPVKAKSDDWKETAAQWRVLLTQCEYGNCMSLNYWTGSRAGPVTIGGVLTCIALDVSVAQEMPEDDLAAMDHYESNFGKSEKSSDVLRIVRGVLESREKVKNLLRNTGISLDEFIAKCSED